MSVRHTSGVDEMSDTAEEIPDFTISHLGVNCENEEEAMKFAGFFESIFGLPKKDGPDSVFTQDVIEWMKKPSYGTKGHIGLATSDLPKAKAYLENAGFEFDEKSAKYAPDGSVLVIYSKAEIAGFSLHLLQR